MGKAIIAFILSVGVGTWLSFFNHGIGVVVSISIKMRIKKTSKKGGDSPPFFYQDIVF